MRSCLRSFRPPRPKSTVLLAMHVPKAHQGTGTLKQTSRVLATLFTCFFAPIYRTTCISLLSKIQGGQERRYRPACRIAMPTCLTQLLFAPAQRQTGHTPIIRPPYTPVFTVPIFGPDHTNKKFARILMYFGGTFFVEISMVFGQSKIEISFLDARRVWCTFGR